MMSSSTSGFSRSRYLRLIAISSVEVSGTIPLATFYIVYGAKNGLKPWKSWADTHSHYSVIVQVPGSAWENVPEAAVGLEMSRWSLVACAFLFFALFGLAAEAREQYHRLYKSLARCIGYSMSTPHGAPHACVLVARSLCWYVPIHWGLHHFFSAVLHQSLM
jgi:pheromone a factor receptor